MRTAGAASQTGGRRPDKENLIAPEIFPKKEKIGNDPKIENYWRALAPFDIFPCEKYRGAVESRILRV